MGKGNSRPGKNDYGFTLVELLVTVMIIGILMMLAIPGYYRVKLRTEEKKAITALYDMYRANKAYFIDYQSYAPDSARLEDYEDFPSTAMDDGDWMYFYDGGDATSFTAHADHMDPYGGTSDGIQIQIDQNGTITRVNWPY